MRCATQSEGCVGGRDEGRGREHGEDVQLRIGGETDSRRITRCEAMRQMVDGVLKELSARFDGLYATVGRPSIAPEKLLRALLIQILYSVRSERLLMEQLDYNLLFRWFVGLEMDDAVWDATVFTKNRERLLEGDIAGAFFEKVLEEAKRRGLLSDEHFTVDGTQIEAWAGQKSFKRKDGSRRQPPPDDPGNPTVDFRGEKRSNETHQSTTDPDARLFTQAARATRRSSVTSATC